MNFYEALNILGLNSNYTEEELNKKYYALVKQYHPDTLTNKSEEEQKELAEKLKKINAARAILIKNLKAELSQSRPNYSNYQNEASDIKLKKHRKEILSFIEKNRYFRNDISREFMGTIYNFNIFVTKYIVEVTNADSKNSLDNIFEDYKKELKAWYHRFKNIYFMRYLIPEKFDFDININLSMDEFYNELENRKKESSIIQDVQKEVDDIISSYDLSLYYEDIKDEIEKLRKETVENILNIDSNLYSYEKNKDYFLDKLKMDIEVLLKRVSTNKPLYLNLLGLVTENAVPFNVEELQESLTDYLFPIYYQELKENIKHYLELDDYYDEVLNVKNTLTSRYHAALNSSNDASFKAKITNLYNKIKNFLYKDHNISTETLRFLNKINFNNYDEALRIFDKVVNNIITLDNVEIYLCSLLEIPSVHIKINDENYTLVSIDGKDVICEYENVDGPQMSLDAFMDNASTFFVKFIYHDEEIIGLYRFNNIILGLCNGHLAFFNDVELTNIDIPPKSKIGKFRSKDYVKGLLINQYYQYIELCKKEKKIVALSELKNNDSLSNDNLKIIRKNQKKNYN